MKYHVNSAGKTEPCGATVGTCPFGEAAHGEFDDYAAAKVFGEAYLKAKEGHQEFITYALEGEKRRKKAKALLEFQESVPASLEPRPFKTWSRRLGRKGLSVQDLYVSTGKKELKEVGEKLGVYLKPEEDFLRGATVLERSGRTPGPWLGELLREAQELQDRGELDAPEALEKYLRSRVTPHTT